MTGLNNNNNYQYPNLPTSIIWPENPKDIPWFMTRLYEEMAFAINQKDNGIFQMAISENPTQIPNLDTTGSYLINVSGSEPYIDSNGRTNYWPSYIFQLTKVDPNADGDWTSTQNTDGVGPTLGAVALTITFQNVPSGTGPKYYFINHSLSGSGIVGSFNVNIQGTRL